MSGSCGFHRHLDECPACAAGPGPCTVLMALPPSAGPGWEECPDCVRDQESLVECPECGHEMAPDVGDDICYCSSPQAVAAARNTPFGRLADACYEQIMGDPS